MKMDSNISKSSSLGSSHEVENISKNLAAVSEQLQKQVRSQHEVLFDQAIHAGRLEETLDVLSDKMCHIRSFIYKLKNHVDYQYNMIAGHTKNAARIHSLLNSLLISKAILDFTRELESTEDLGSLAKIHYKIYETLKEEEVVDLHIIQEEWSLIKSNRRKIQKLTQIDLLSGLQEKKEAQVEKCLQVLLNLKAFDESMKSLISNYVKDIEKSLKEYVAGNEFMCFKKEPKKPISTELKPKVSSTSTIRPGKPSLVTMNQNFRDNLWKCLNRLILEELFECCQQVETLQKCLKALTRKDLQKSLDVQSMFWSQVQTVFRMSLLDPSLPIFQALHEDYPKLIKIVNDFEDRCGKGFIFERENLSNLEKKYIDMVAANIELCFETNSPKKETLDMFLNTALMKLADAAVDEELVLKVVQIFTKYGEQFCLHLKEKIKIGRESNILTDAPSTEQEHNTSIANLLTYYKLTAKHFLLNLTYTSNKIRCAQGHLEATIQEAEQLTFMIVQNLIASIYQNANKILLSMHREKNLSDDSASTTGPSMYIREFQEYLSRSWHIHITPFEDKDIVNKCGLDLASKCIQKFVQNMSFVRPLSAFGRSRLKEDCLFLEQTLKPFCSNMLEIGNCFRVLRKMSELIIQSPTELVEEGRIQDSVVPRHTVIILLFGHGGPDLQSPHTAAGWSSEQFIDWLDLYKAERDILKLISSTIHRYRENIRLKKTDKYDPVYPFIINLLELSFS